MVAMAERYGGNCQALWVLSNMSLTARLVLQYCRGHERPPGMYEPIRQIYESAAAIDAEVSITWASRDTTGMQLADEFSRDEDASQMFVLHGTMVVACAALFDGAAQWPTVDVFAGAGPGEHVVLQFFTEFVAAGSLGTDAFARRWNDGISSDAAALAWVFPSSGCELRAINASAEQRVNAILVLLRCGSAAVWLSLMHRVLPAYDCYGMSTRLVLDFLLGCVPLMLLSKTCHIGSNG